MRQLKNFILICYLVFGISPVGFADPLFLPDRNLKSTHPLMKSPGTIGEVGCYVTSLSNLLVGQGFRELPDVGPVNPGTLSQFLAERPDGYVFGVENPGAIEWFTGEVNRERHLECTKSKGGPSCEKLFGYRLKYRTSLSREEAISELRKGNAPMFEVHSPLHKDTDDCYSLRPAQFPGCHELHSHFVLGNGLRARAPSPDILIADPADDMGARKTLSAAAYQDKFRSARLFYRAPISQKDKGSIYVYAVGAQFSVTNPSGQLAGWDPAKKQVILNDKGAFYQVSAVSDDTTDGSNYTDPVFIYESTIAPEPGTYRIRVHRRQAGKYKVAALFYDESGRWNGYFLAKEPEGPVRASFDEFEFVFSPKPNPSNNHDGGTDEKPVAKDLGAGSGG